MLYLAKCKETGADRLQLDGDINNISRWTMD